MRELEAYLLNLALFLQAMSSFRVWAILACCGGFRAFSLCLSSSSSRYSFCKSVSLNSLAFPVILSIFSLSSFILTLKIDHACKAFSALISAVRVKKLIFKTTKLAFINSTHSKLFGLSAHQAL